MMIAFPIVSMLIVAYAFFREGVFSALCMLVNVIIAGLVAFNFFEPLADLLDPVLHGSVVDGFEDFLVLIGLYAVTLLVLRMLTDAVAPRTIEYPAILNQFGGAAVGLLVGYLVCGFLLCTLQTLPWEENFLGFEPRKKEEPSSRSFFPPDRVRLSLMRYAGAGPFANRTVPDPSTEESPSLYDTYETFDRNATFELRYQRYRRYGDKRDPLPYRGELDSTLNGTH